MSDGQPDEAPDTEALKNDLDAIGNVRLMPRWATARRPTCLSRWRVRTAASSRRCRATATSHARVCTTGCSRRRSCRARRVTPSTPIRVGEEAARRVHARVREDAVLRRELGSGLDGLGDSGSSVAQLLAVCMDMDMIVSLDVLEPPSVRSSRRRSTARAGIARHRLRAQLETIRAKMSDDSVCGSAPVSAAAAAAGRHRRGRRGAAPSSAAWSAGWRSSAVVVVMVLSVPARRRRRRRRPPRPRW